VVLHNGLDLIFDLSAGSSKLEQKKAIDCSNAKVLFYNI
jgi:hypothetical protein